MINNVVLIGRLTKDVDLKYTNNGAAVGSFTLAVERSFKDSDGNKQVDFINCTIWRKAAESFANYTRKGLLVSVQGRMQTRNYENQQGQRVYVTEVNVEQFQFLEFKNDKTDSDESNQNDSDSFANSGESVDINDDDLPF